MKSFVKLLQTSGGLLLLTMVLLSPLSCTKDFFSQVDDPALSGTRGQDDCKMYIVGQVKDAKTLQPIPAVAIQLFDQGAISDVNGMYMIEVPFPDDESEGRRLMWTLREGYEMDTYQFLPSDWIDGDCEGSISYICVDFVLSPKGLPILLTPSAPISLSISDTTRFITEENEAPAVNTIITKVDLNIPAGAVDVPTTIYLSTYSRASYLGATDIITNNLPLLRFRISSESMDDLKLPFSVSFSSDHPIPYSASDSLNVYRMNDKVNPFINYLLPSNLWRDPTDAQAKLNPLSGKIEVRSRALGSYMVQNMEYNTTAVEGYSYETEIGLGAVGNCNCGEAFIYNYTVNIDGRMSMLPQGWTIFDRLIYLNDLKVLHNLPFSSLTYLGKSPVGSNNFYQFDPPVKSISAKRVLSKCSYNYVFSRGITANTGGSVYGPSYNMRRSIGTQIRFQEDRCPTTTSCHQGCP